MTHPLNDVLDDLAGLVATVGPDQAGRPTPCPDYDVAELRRHLLGWLPVFATALADPDGTDRPDPNAYRAPDDADEAAAQVKSSAARIAAALDDGVEGRPVRLLDGQLPGQAVVGMLTGEVIAHGWDLARATGHRWEPDQAACRAAAAALQGMLAPQFRGPGKPFGDEVPVGPDAGPLERLLGFAGRDPNWTPPA
jgi:uncharacterized protein (TIGR03086 family)